jgi:glycine/D-amino acid oxidase-like deaminating enzyme
MADAGVTDNGRTTSVWMATTPMPENQGLASDARADVCIVGGGFTGLSAALHLAQAGTEVMVLEAVEPGWGASGRNGGQVIPGLKLDPDEVERRLGPERGQRLVALAGGAADLVFALIGRHRIDCHAHRCGWIQAAHSSSALKRAEECVRQWTRRGADVEPLTRTQIEDELGTEAYCGGWLDRRGGSLQPLSYARGLAQAAARARARIHGRSPAGAIDRANGRWRVAAPEGAVLADQVLLCTNGYTDRLWPGLARSIVPAVSYQAATKPLSDNLRRTVLPHGHVVSDTRRLLLYFRLDPDGRLIIGGRGRSSESSNPALYSGVMANLGRLFPQLGNPGWEFFWGGRVALTLDHLPHLHELATGVFAGLGYNGRGVAMATAMGHQLALRALGRSAQELAFPSTPLAPIPLHALRRPALAVTVAWKRLLDAWDGWTG